MKIVALIRTSPGSNHYVNQVHRLYKIERVIIETMPSMKNRIKKKLKEHGLMGVITQGLTRVYNKISERKNFPIYNHIFNDTWSILDYDIKTETVDNINAQRTIDLLKEIKPDVVIVRGTSIIFNRTIESVPLTLNLHAGLSPYYRGTHCSEWALFNWDPYNIGSTLHKVTPNIDGGNILGQVRIDIDPQDNIISIEAKMCAQGTSMLLDALRFIKDGKKLIFHRQNLSIGYLNLHRQWTIYCSKQIQHIIKNRVIDNMLKTPSRGKLPIIELLTGFFL